MNFEQRIVVLDTKRLRRWLAAAFLFALVALLYKVGHFLVQGVAAIRFPGELDYGEGIVWEQTRLILAGRGYGAIDGLPAIVFHYPPVFHLFTAALASASKLDQLAAGRSLSICSTILIAVFAGLIAAQVVRAEVSTRAAVVCGLVAGLTIFCFWPITYWAPLMRVDMLATALSFAGLLVAMMAFSRPPLIAVSAILFVTAVYTKQTSIVAPASVFVTFLVLRPKLAWLLAASCIAIGLVILGALMIATEGGFVRHIFLYNVNRMDPKRLVTILMAIISHLLFFAVVVIGVTARIKARLPMYRGAGSIVELRQRLHAAPGDAFFLLVLVYAVLAFIMTFTIAKSGSSVNYLIEWLAVVAILLGIVARDAANILFGAVPMPSKRPFAHPTLVPLLIGLQALLPLPTDGYAKQRAPARLSELETLQSMVRSASRPVISDDMVLLMRAGVPVQWEPAIFAELASTGKWNEAPFVARIKARQFAFFITEGNRGEWLFDSRYNPAVADAMYAAYPVRREIAGYTIHFPSKTTT